MQKIIDNDISLFHKINCPLWMNECMCVCDIRDYCDISWQRIINHQFDHFTWFSGYTYAYLASIGLLRNKSWEHGDAKPRVTGQMKGKQGCECVSKVLVKDWGRLWRLSYFCLLRREDKIEFLGSSKIVVRSFVLLSVQKIFVPRNTLSVNLLLVDLHIII